MIYSMQDSSDILVLEFVLVVVFIQFPTSDLVLVSVLVIPFVLGCIQLLYSCRKTTGVFDKNSTKAIHCEWLHSHALIHVQTINQRIIYHSKPASVIQLHVQQTNHTIQIKVFVCYSYSKCVQTGYDMNSNSNSIVHWQLGQLGGFS